MKEEKLKTILKELSQQKYVPAVTEYSRGWNQGVNLSCKIIRDEIKKESNEKEKSRTKTISSKSIKRS